MKNTLAVLLVVAFAGCVLADQAAVQQCRTIHHADADSTSSFSNYQCYLRCYIHGQLYPHLMNEGHHCPGLVSNNYVCHSGQCVAATKQGHIDIEITSGSLSQGASAYVSACITNSSTPVPVPIKDRSKCTSCVSNMAPYGNTPVWNNVCAGSGRSLFNSDARITFEMFDHKGQGNNIFLGGASLTIDQLLAHGDSHRAIHLPITGGSVAGQLNTIITWTPLN